MKLLSETYRELGIAFTFPITIIDANGNRTYYENSDRFWMRYERDANGDPTYYENSRGIWSRYERDANGKQTYFENSHGIKEGTPRSTINQ